MKNAVPYLLFPLILAAGCDLPAATASTSAADTTNGICIGENFADNPWTDRGESGFLVRTADGQFAYAVSVDFSRLLWFAPTATQADYDHIKTTSAVNFRECFDDTATVSSLFSFSLLDHPPVGDPPAPGTGTIIPAPKMKLCTTASALTSLSATRACQRPRPIIWHPCGAGGLSICQ